PGRFSRQHEDRLFAHDQFPFSYATTTDPVSGKTDGILARCQASNTCPRIMQTEASTDFWEGRAGLLVTDGKSRYRFPIMSVCICSRAFTTAAVRSLRISPSIDTQLTQPSMEGGTGPWCARWMNGSATECYRRRAASRA